MQGEGFWQRGMMTFAKLCGLGSAQTKKMVLIQSVKFNLTKQFLP